MSEQSKLILTGATEENIAYYANGVNFLAHKDASGSIKIYFNGSLIIQVNEPVNNKANVIVNSSFFHAMGEQGLIKFT